MTRGALYPRSQKEPGCPTQTKDWFNEEPREKWEGGLQVMGTQLIYSVDFIIHQEPISNTQAQI